MAAAGMAMPEAAMDEADGPEARKHQIRRSRQFAIMQTVPQSEPVELAAQDKFRAGVLAADGPHHPGPNLGGDCVNHASPGASSMMQERSDSRVAG